MHWLSYILLLLYVIGLLAFVYKSNFFNLHSISKKQLSIILVIKFCFGILYLLIHQYVVTASDIFFYFNDGNTIFATLKENPFHYLRLVFAPNNTAIIPEDLSVTIHNMFFWSDSGSYMIVRFNALIRIISFGNIYIHALAASFFSFLGCFLIAKIFEDYLKQSFLVSLSVFLSPSILFWATGIHKEFVSVLGLGLILYHFLKLSKSFNSPINILGFVAGLVLFFFTRNYMLLSLIPSLLAFSVHKIFHVRFRRALFFSLIALVSFLNYAPIPDYNLTGFEVIIEKRLQFEALKYGNTAIELDPIDANFVSLMQNSPKALFNALFRPHFLEVNTLLLFLAMLENIVIAILVIIAFLNFHKLTRKESNIVILLLLYSLFLLLLIGWIVPNIGAILRYRSVALVILIPTLVFVFTKSKLYLSIERKTSKFTKALKL